MRSKMIDVRPFLRFSTISIAVYFTRLLRKTPACMALLAAPPTKSLSPRCNGQRRDDLSKMRIHNVFAKGGNAVDFSPIIKKRADEFKPTRKRPSRLIVPTCFAGLDLFHNVQKKLDCMKDFEAVKGRDFVLASKKGRREVMEDRHAAILDISGDPKQAFFVVIDGHGGHAAADYVAENLGKNILNELKRVGKAGNQIEAALRGGYSATDKQFLAQDLNGGACAAGVLLKDGKLHAANVGDCKVVLSKNGKAIALTNDHRLNREDERIRIENSGGFLHCHNGTWRVNGSLAVSRAFGNLHLKDWIICEPDTVTIPLTPDCEFVIVASDGLWDMVSGQEAVDMVKIERNLLESCRKLVDMSSSRGNRDDITVMMINLQNFKINIA